jgi:hypothetical protein
VQRIELAQIENKAAQHAFVLAGSEDEEGLVRCALFDRNLHSRMPLSFTPFGPPFEMLPCV